MQAAENHGALLRFSTRDLPENERIPFWREVFARQIVRIDVEPQSDGALCAEATLLALPGLRAMWSRSLTPTRWARTPELLADGDDGVALLMAVRGAAIWSQLGQDLELKPHDGVAVLHSEPAKVQFCELDYVSVVLPRAAIASLVTGVESAARRLVPGRTEAMRLLRGYLATMRRNADIADAALGKLIATHVCDLVALAVGPTNDGRAIAAGRGARAARLQAIKMDFAANPSLTLSSLASRQNVTPRYVQQLFETDGTTFTAYAVDQRLTAARRMLTSRRHAHLTIGAIALASGFGDVSHFNRTFRRRYGASPSEVRAEALR
jgi:AraC-like DNA-binding protein